MSALDTFNKTGINIISTDKAFKDREDLQLDSDNKIVKPVLKVTKEEVQEIVKMGLVPDSYVGCDFDIEKIKLNIAAQQKAFRRNFNVEGFKLYESVITGILATIIAGKIPKQSYIIGAPNGFGKTSFVYSSIIRLYANGRKCAPYVSLSELAEIKRSLDIELVKGLSGTIIKDYEAVEESRYKQLLLEKYNTEVFVKKPINILSSYSWSEYMYADVLFCYFTEISSKVVESQMLKHVISIRGARGLPTIALISTSLEPYLRDKALKDYVWDEIMAYTDGESCDRVKHISCYKNFNIPMMIKEENKNNGENKRG